MSPKRLAIIGCGSSGLITLKLVIDSLPDWEIRCFEKSGSIVGCWGKPHPSFVSTSTKFTTQFACHAQYDATVNGDGSESRDEFFQSDEYGQYLESFANRFQLHRYISLHTLVEQIVAAGDRWQLTVAGKTRTFDAVVLCTGLAAAPKSIDCCVEQLSVAELNHPNGLDHVRGRKIVVVGGGESAVDYADRLARPELENEVLLSLKTGIRVSPRYHPVRGVPSDFLRNRLMLSVHPDVRNYLGQIFVELRIKYEPQFRRLFPGKRLHQTLETDSEEQKRKEWTIRLTAAAKDDLFNMFHNKSDDFLNNVGKGRIQIVGPPQDESWTRFEPFNEPTGESVAFESDLVVPGIGYQSTLASLSKGQISMDEFFLGCCHAEHDNLFAVGFARPIIGNIPTISEMQAQYICRLLAGDVARPTNVSELHEIETRQSTRRFAKLNLTALYPVEMFPYCDRLAKMMGLKIGASFLESPRRWWKKWSSPATTLHYFEDEPEAREKTSDSRRYMPSLLVLFILVLKPIDWVWKLWKQLRNRGK